MDPASDSIANPGRWITENPPPGGQLAPTPHVRMNTVHVCLIPLGAHRGEVLVWDGNLTNHGVRAYQPWSIVNPYWPALNPNPWLGQAAVQHRFHNATLAMPLVGGVPEGELFCAGQCWMGDGLLLVCGGTKAYPNPAIPGSWFQGAKFVYLWDHTPTAGNPFGTWWPMAPRELEVPRWYPTVTFYGTPDHRSMVIGGTHWTQSGGTQDVNSYEVVRPAFNVYPPQLSTPPFDTKSTAHSPPWPSGLPASNRQYWGPDPAYPAHFGDYPRIHALGILDPIGGGTAPRLFVSGFHTAGIRWAHDSLVDPVFSAVQGFEIGQMPAGADDMVGYPTSLLLPGLPGGISKQVARIGGLRFPLTFPTTPPYTSNLVETAWVNVSPPTTSTWLTSGSGSIPPMNRPRWFGNVVHLPTGDLFAIGGVNGNPTAYFNSIPELLVGGTTWVDMAPHAGARDYHSAAILLPDGRVFVCGGEHRKDQPNPGPDYLIWEPPYFNLAEGPTGITVRNEATSVTVEQHLIGPLGMQYGKTYRADWTNTLEAGTSISVVLMRPAALTHHDDGGQRMVRLNAWDDGTPNSVVFQSPASVQHAPYGWWMLFLVSSDYRPSKAYWVHLL